MFNVSQWVQQYQDGSHARVTMTKPEQVTCWTKTGANDPAGNRFLFGDASGVASYRRPQAPLDLNQGYPASYTRKPEGESSPVDTIIQAAAAEGVDWAHFQVCSYRNNLNKILLTTINREDWQMHCCFHGGSATLFLDIIPSPQASFRDADKFCYYGYKFEAVCTDGGNGQVDATSEFGIVVTYRLGRLQVLMAAEIDAAMPGGPAAAGDGGGEEDEVPHYVEMKTYTIPRHTKASGDMYAVKHPRWWVQSYLAGVPTLVLGGRDPRGTLLKIQEVPVQALPGMSAHANHGWDADLLLAFGEAVLVWLKEQASARPDKQLRAWYDAGSNTIHCEGKEEGDMPQRLDSLVV